jgi:hypothetical protein
MYSNWTIIYFLEGKELAQEFIDQLSWATLQMALGIKKRDNYITSSMRGKFDAVTIYEWQRGKKTLIKEMQEV